jgi:hypothetical protein
VSWHFEVHRGGRGEYDPGESDDFPPLDEAAARDVLGSVAREVKVEVFGDAESDDDIQWVGDALVVEVSLLRGRDGRVRVVGFRFSSTGEARDRYDAEQGALMKAVFDVAHRAKGELYDQEGAAYRLPGSTPAPPVPEFDFHALSRLDAVASALEAIPKLGLAERRALKDWKLLIDLPQDLRPILLSTLVLQTIEDAWGVDFDTANRLATEIVEKGDLAGVLWEAVDDRRFNELPRNLKPLARAFAARALISAVVAKRRLDENNLGPPTETQDWD